MKDKITMELRRVPMFDAAGKLIPRSENKLSVHSQAKRELRHTGNDNVFKGSSSTIVHSVSKTLKVFAHKAGFNKYQ